MRWHGERLELVDRPVHADDLDDELLADTLRAFREELLEVADKLQRDQRSNAVDPRYIEELRSLSEKIPLQGTISRVTLIRLARHAEAIQYMLNNLSEDERLGWPSSLLENLKHVTKSFSDLLQKFHTWRKVKAHTQKAAADMDEASVELAVPAAEELAAMLEDTGPEHVDPRIPQLLEELKERLREFRDAAVLKGQQIGQWLKALAADLWASMANIVKVIFSWLLKKLRLFARAADDELNKQLKKLGKGLVRWAFRFLKIGFYGGPPVWVAHKFDWLMPILNWLQHQPWVQTILKSMGF